MLNNPMNAVTTKFVRTSTNKVKCPVFVVRVSTVLELLCCVALMMAVKASLNKNSMCSV